MKTSTKNLNYFGRTQKKSFWLDENLLMAGITGLIFLYLIFRFAYPIVSKGIL